MRQVNIEARNEKIKEDYKKLAEKKEHGVEVHTHDYICNKLAYDYWLHPTTIHFIVTGYNVRKKVPKFIYKNEKPEEPKNNNQTSLF